MINFNCQLSIIIFEIPTLLIVHVFYIGVLFVSIFFDTVGTQVTTPLDFSTNIHQCVTTHYNYDEYMYVVNWQIMDILYYCNTFFLYYCVCFRTVNH